MLVQFHRFHTAHSIPIRDSIKLWYHVHRVESPVQLYFCDSPIAMDDKRILTKLLSPVLTLVCLPNASGKTAICGL